VNRVPDSDTGRLGPLPQLRDLAEIGVAIAVLVFETSAGDVLELIRDG
jgi:hypothetical protein